VGLRNTLEPDPDNTGVGSFLRAERHFFQFHRSSSSFVSGKTKQRVPCQAAAISPGSPFHSFIVRPFSQLVLLTCCPLPCRALAAPRRPQAPVRIPSPPSPRRSSPAPPAPQKPAPVTTTVVVHGEIEDNYLPESVTVGTLDGAPLRETPLSATVVTRDLLNDQVSRLLSDVVKNDASVGDDYVPVGYYGDYQIRGFPLDLATGLEINGMTIAGEQDVPLENKQSRSSFSKALPRWKAAWPRPAASSTTSPSARPTSRPSIWPPIIAEPPTAQSISAISSAAASRWARA
jgi:hypothetical protein